MKTVGIVAEYNPFHKGHEYHMAEAKRLTGADFCVVVMSGDFVQRGEPAIADKHSRARAALLGGADLVLELPAPYACGSAEDFARGAISVLTDTGVASALCFGSETGDLSPLMEYARLFNEEPAGYRELLKDNLRGGMSWPAARSRAASEYKNYTERILPCCADDADCRSLALPDLTRPNDILGVEYLRALMRLKSSIKPVTISRRGAAYDDPSLDREFPSASAIRRALLNRRPGLGGGALADFGTGKGFVADTHADSGNDFDEICLSALPAYSGDIIRDLYDAGALMAPDDFSAALSYLILTLSHDELASFQDVGSDLASRLHNLRFDFTTVSAFADLTKTKQLTHTRVTRALTHILLGLKQDEMDEYRKAGYPVYLHALGFRREASALLRAINDRGESSLIVKAADAPRQLSGLRLRLFEKTALASDLYGMTRSRKSGTDFREICSAAPVII